MGGELADSSGALWIKGEEVGDSIGVCEKCDDGIAVIEDGVDFDIEGLEVGASVSCWIGLPGFKVASGDGPVEGSGLCDKGVFGVGSGEGMFVWAESILEVGPGVGCVIESGDVETGLDWKLGELLGDEVNVALDVGEGAGI